MQDSTQPTSYVLFVIGAAIGSALGLVLGSLLTFWVGQGLVRTVQRLLGQLSKQHDRPNFELLMQ